MDSLHLARRSGLPPSENAWRIQRALLDFLETDWQKPDEGIWEVRGPRRQFTHSKVMAWVAMDRAVKSVEEFGLEGEASKWRRLRSQIHEEVCREGFDPALNSFVQYYGSKEPDASLLMLPLVGFLPATDPQNARHRGLHPATTCSQRFRRPLRTRSARGRIAGRRRGIPALHLLACRQSCAPGPIRRGEGHLRTAARTCAMMSGYCRSNTIPKPAGWSETSLRRSRMLA